MCSVRSDLSAKPFSFVRLEMMYVRRAHQCYIISAFDIRRSSWCFVE